MQNINVNQFYFSPTGTTKTVVETIAQEFDSNQMAYDLLKHPLEKELILDAQSLAIVGIPVYSGRVPEICVQMLSKLKGENTPVIAVVVYGNRDYDDALLELKDILQTSGFIVFAAGAFIGQHSIFPNVGCLRPDINDKKIIADFAHKCSELLNAGITLTSDDIQVKGKFPYKTTKPVPVRPKASKKCTQCNACIKICPTNAIDVNNPRLTDKKKCISCAACIQICPVKARNFTGFMYMVGSRQFNKAYTEYRKPETFFR